MQSVAIAWQIYAMTGRPLDLAWVGLAQFLPGVCFSLVSGHAADRFERRRILTVCYGALAALSVALFAMTHAGSRSLHTGPIYAVLVAVGDRARVPGTGQPVHPAVARAHRPLRQCRRLGVVVLADRDGARPHRRGTRLCGVRRTGARVRARGGVPVRGLRARLDDSAAGRSSEGRRADNGRRCSRACATSGPTRSSSEPSPSISSPCCSAAPRPSCPCTRATFCTSDRGRSGSCGARPPRAPPSRRWCSRVRPIERGAGARCSPAWRSSGVATIAFGLSRSFAGVARGPPRRRRLGHGERLRALRARAARHPRRDARPGERRQHGLHRGQQRARRVRIRAHGAVAREPSPRSSSGESARSWSWRYGRGASRSSGGSGAWAMRRFWRRTWPGQKQKKRKKSRLRTSRTDAWRRMR